MPKGQARMPDKNVKPKLAHTHADQFRQIQIQTKNQTTSENSEKIRQIQTKSDKFRPKFRQIQKNQTNSEKLAKSDKFRQKI